MKGKLVQFSDGTYGVRVGWLFEYRFRDLVNPEFSWAIGVRHFKDCQGTRDQAEKHLNSFTYRVINEAQP